MWPDWAIFEKLLASNFIAQIFGYFWSYFKASLFEKKMVWLLFCQLFENLGYFFILRMWLHLAPALLLILSPACLAGNHYWWMNNPSVFSSGNQGGSSQGGDSGSYGAPSQNLQVDSQGRSHFCSSGFEPVTFQKWGIISTIAPPTAKYCKVNRQVSFYFALVDWDHCTHHRQVSIFTQAKALPQCNFFLCLVKC